MTPRDAVAFIEKHGIVLERARGTVPCLVEAIVGEPVRGSWWAHPQGRRIFKILAEVQDSPDVLRCRLVGDKITYAHRRVWPALVRLADRIGRRPLDRLAQTHTRTGAHRPTTTPFPTWVPQEVAREARRLAEDEALGIVAPFLP